MLRRGIGMLAVGALAVAPALAVIAPQGQVPEDRPKLIKPAVGDAAIQKTLTEQSQAWKRFQSQHGDRWTVRWNERSAAAAFLQGSGIRLIDARSRDLAELESAARNFLGRHGQLLGVRPSDLRLSKGAGFQGRDREVGYAHFDQYYQGLPVHQGRVYLRVKHGNLVQVDALTFPGIDVSVQPALTPEAAVERGLAHARRTGTDVTRGDLEARLVVFPEETSAGYDYHLAWKVGVDTVEPFGIWTYYVDAHTGDFLDRFNKVHNVSDGTVTGEVRPHLPTDPTITVGLEGIDVTVGTQTVATDGEGFYFSPLDGLDRSAMLTGQRLSVLNDAGPEAVVSANGNGTVDLAFTTANARVDEMTTWHWVHEISNEAQVYLDFPWLNQELVANVNINATCNATYSGEINFFREGGGCANTGEFSDVIAHEWGHAIDDNDGNGITDSAFSEGYSDLMGIIVSNDCGLARGFFIGGGPLRDSCEPCTVSECTSFDPHITGQIYTSAMWCVRESLEAKLGSAPGIEKWKELSFVSLPTITFLDGTYDATLFADDDDGNLANGTPNLCEINSCFADVELVERLPSEAAPVSAIATIDDSAGNGNGFAETGETVVMTLEVANSGCAALTNAVATLTTTTPGVTIQDATVNLGDITGPGSVDVPYTIEIGGGVACGTAIDLDLALASDQGNFSFAEVLAVGPEANAFFDSMEADNGWTTENLGATTGAWERAVPQETDQGGIPAQPGADHTGTGSLAFVTEAAAGTGVGSFDLDGGPVILTSPVFDLSGVPGARVSYWRWFYNGSVFNDSLIVEASDDAGATWTVLEEVTGVQNSYQEASFDLQSFIAMTDQVQVRFTTSDNPNDSIVEVVIDDFRIDATECSGIAPAVTATAACDPGPHAAPTTVPIDVSATNTTGVSQTVQATIDNIDTLGTEFPRTNVPLTLNAGQTRSGTIPLQISNQIAPGEYTVRVRVADGTQILDEATCNLTVE